MKWLVVTGLLATLLSYGGGSAIRCTPGKDASCSVESEKEVPPPPVVSPVNQEPAGKEPVRQQLAAQDLAAPQLTVQESSAPPPLAQETASQQPTSQESAANQVECLAGSEWFSNCHYCRCSDSGIAECLREETCDDGVFVPPQSEVNPVNQEPAGKESVSQQLAAQSLAAPQLTVQESSAPQPIAQESASQQLTAQESASQQPTSQESAANQVECLAGSEWFSNCHYCRCSDSGIAECLREETCDDGVFEEPLQCKPNTTFVRDCNTCVCLENGLALCTIEFCRRSGSDVSVSKIPVVPFGVECAPGTMWKPFSCGYCWCSDIGYKQCFYHDCHEKAKETDMSCAPNTTWNDGCNTCTCLSNGRKLCTSLFCKDHKVPSKPEVHQRPIGVECAPGTTWKSGCSECRCSDIGYSQCDHVVCEQKVKEPERRCAPDTTWFDGCNTCWCFSSGHSMCTQMACFYKNGTEIDISSQLKTADKDRNFNAMVKKSSKNSTKEVVCVANRMFIKDCNTCWCNDDGTGYFCTRKVCVPELPDESSTEEEKPEQELRIIHKDCRPDEVFELECNMCRCNPDGKSFSCTRRACIEQEDAKNMTMLARRVRATPQEAPKACQPGQEFRLDCNKCLCDNEGQDFSCTRIDCNALNNNNNGGGRSKRGASDLDKISSECTPGSVFEKECNTCRCTTDGHHAMCTNKRCTTEVKQTTDNDVHSTEADPGFRCDPGEQFKKDCKDCTCSADGKSYFCTLHLCDEFIAPGVIQQPVAAWLSPNKVPKPLSLARRTHPGVLVATFERLYRLGGHALEHALGGPNHYIRFDRPQILAAERRFVPRMMREAIEIKKYPTFNREDVKIQKKCVPTTVVRGPCHACVCDVEGVYQCKEQSCTQDAHKYDSNTSTKRMECVPNLMFRENNLICTCTHKGFWKAKECRKIFNHIREEKKFTVSLNKIDRTCKSNSLYLIGCNICRCSKRGLIEAVSCTSRPCTKGHKVKPCSFGDILRTKDELCSCSNINVYTDRLCLKVDDRKKQIISETALESIISVGDASSRIQDIYDKKCIPKTVLNIDCNRCVCTEKKTLACTERGCVNPSKAIMRLKESYSKFFSLPVLKSEDDKCTPGQKYRFDCNTCTCSSDAVPICTTMFCLKDYNRRHPIRESADFS
ncbi:unnamed protein product [Chilo suppressalis]|uniref:Pacifastin domain-containing protein n=1 Tax=Chilo suppressalis TaxID=168631 RepID=A0ABN8BAF8_CHISP|nr:unnamed protein product [Chilo suppressalis]